MTASCIARTRAATVVILRGAIDLDLADELETCLFEAIEQHTDVVVELTDAALIDCACLGVLVRANRRAVVRGVRLSLAAPRPLIRRTLTATGLDGVFPVFDDVSDAVNPSAVDQMPVLAERTAVRPWSLSVGTSS